jgi:hypothetical protein
MMSLRVLPELRSQGFSEEDLEVGEKVELVDNVHDVVQDNNAIQDKENVDVVAGSLIIAPAVVEEVIILPSKNTSSDTKPISAGSDERDVDMSMELDRKSPPDINKVNMMENESGILSVEKGYGEGFNSNSDDDKKDLSVSDTASIDSLGGPEDDDLDNYPIPNKKRRRQSRRKIKQTPVAVMENVEIPKIILEGNVDNE